MLTSASVWRLDRLFRRSESGQQALSKSVQLSERVFVSAAHQVELAFAGLPNARRHTCFERLRTRLCWQPFRSLTCTSREMVAQLTNNLSRAFTSKLSPGPAKICRRALSSVTTVKITSAAAVTSDKSARQRNQAPRRVLSLQRDWCHKPT